MMIMSTDTIKYDFRMPGLSDPGDIIFCLILTIFVIICIVVEVRSTNKWVEEQRKKRGESI